MTNPSGADIDHYQAAYQADYGFEAEMVRYRQAHVMAFLERQRPACVIEIGCGPDLLAGHYHAAGGHWQNWVMVEPAPDFAAVARASNLPNTHVHQGFFQDVARELPQEPDVVICAGLLHEVPDADDLTAAIAGVMGPNTVIHANVPNARSLHRQLAQAMGLIEDLATPSPRNRELGQPRVFDAESLRQMIEAAGLKITATGGHLVKPFTHSQMDAISDKLGRDVLDGLYRLGESNPDWASEISVEARLA